VRLICCFLLLLSTSVNAAPVITYFYDGDTVKINDGMTAYKLRLSNIDAPERNQAYGLKSRRALMQLCKNTEVQVQLSGIDKYQRNLGKLQCNQQDASTFMLENGHAWFNTRYSSDGTLAHLEQTARQKQLGLWANKNPIAPWIWRQKHLHTFTK
jgi:micrococcal nuclease